MTAMRLRATLIVLITLVAAPWVPIRPVQADNGSKQGRPAAAPRESAANWIQKRHRDVRIEAHRRTQQVERMRARLDRDLLNLRRARIALLRCSGSAAAQDGQDRVLTEVGRMRGRVAQAAAMARRDLAAPVTETARSWSRFVVKRSRRTVPRIQTPTIKVSPKDTPPRAPARPPARTAVTARVAADATRARMRMTRTSRTFGHIVVVERKKVVQLAAENARVASVLLDGPRRPVGEASKRRVTDARRVLHNLKKLGSTERRKIRHQLVRDARRIRKTQQAVAVLEQRLQEVRRQIRALRTGKKRARPVANKPARPRTVPASTPAPVAGRPNASD